DPDSGPTAGGTVVTITGTGFTGATGVTFDGAAGTAFTVDSDTQITVTTPPGAAGPVDVIVQGAFEDSTAGALTYIAAPAITTIDPNTGADAERTVATVTSIRFMGVTRVTIEGG